MATCSMTWPATALGISCGACPLQLLQLCRLFWRVPPPQPGRQIWLRSSALLAEATKENPLWLKKALLVHNLAYLLGLPNVL